MPKKPKKPNNNSQESTLGPLAKALGDIDADKPAAVEPEEPGGGGDSGVAPKGEAKKSEAPPEGETPEGL